MRRVENNVIDDCPDASVISFQNCTNFKAFNNQSTDGRLRRAYDVGASRYRLELQDFAEDALLGF